MPYLSRGSYLETKGNILTMESLFANRIRDYNGLVLQAFKNISILSYTDAQRQSSMLMSEYLFRINIDYSDKTRSICKMRKILRKLKC